MRFTQTKAKDYIDVYDSHTHHDRQRNETKVSCWFIFKIHSQRHHRKTIPKWSIKYTHLNSRRRLVSQSVDADHFIMLQIIAHYYLVIVTHTHTRTLRRNAITNNRIQSYVSSTCAHTHTNTTREKKLTRKLSLL